MRQDESSEDASPETSAGSTASVSQAVEAIIASGEVPEPFRIMLTEDALAQAEALATTEPSYQGRPLRVYIEGKGCDGFYYGVAFDEKIPGDLAWRQGGIELIADAESFRFTHGSYIEWIDDERGRGFLVENPNHRKFRGKFYKRRSWQELLERKAPAT